MNCVQQIWLIHNIFGWFDYIGIKFSLNVNLGVFFALTHEFEMQ